MTASTKSSSELTFPSDREVLGKRTFDAPRDLVFKALIDPDLIPSWWGPRAYTTIVEKMDVRPGGRWRFINRAPDGNDYGFGGEYREIAPPERLVYTFEFDGAPGHVMVETITLHERGDRTELHDHMLFDSVEARDGMVQSGMEEGGRETMDRLAELLASGRVK